MNDLILLYCFISYIVLQRIAALDLFLQYVHYEFLVVKRSLG